MSDETMKAIVNRIKERRIELGYSFQDLANLTGMSKSTLQRYETGSIKNIPLDKLKVLASALRVSPEWIMGWDAESNLARSVYYLEPGAVELAQEMYERPEMRVLFDASRKASKEDIEMVAKMLEKMYKAEKGED